MPQTDAQLIGRGVAFPPRVDAEGRLASSEGAQHVRESIRIILSTERRERVMFPEFGGGLRRQVTPIVEMLGTILQPKTWKQPAGGISLSTNYLSLLKQYILDAVRNNNLPWAMDGVAMHNSSRSLM